MGNESEHAPRPKTCWSGIQCAFETREIAVHPIQDKCARLIVFGGVVPNSFGAHWTPAAASSTISEASAAIARICFVDEGGVTGRIEEFIFTFSGSPGACHSANARRY